MSTLVAGDPAVLPRQQNFSRFAWMVLLYNIPVILWGAYVRVSFSGDGCGAHWPFCNGQLLPQQMHAPTLIELTHRLMTSLDLIAVAALLVWAFRRYPRQHAVRKYACWCMAFLLIEAVLGAGLVVFRKVAHDQSAGRAVYLSAHLMNTLLLLGAMTVTAWAAQRSVKRFSMAQIPARIVACLGLIMLVSVSGVVAALGDMLFPATSLSSGLMQDFGGTGSPLLHLRFLHPILAIGSALFILYVAIGRSRLAATEVVRLSASRVVSVVVFQLAVGAMNLGLLAPIWMQLIHLLIADVVWIVALLWALEDASTNAQSRVVLR